MTDQSPKRATLYRMVMPEHVCPYGLKAKHFCAASSASR